MQNVLQEQRKLLISCQALVPSVLGTKPGPYLVLPVLASDRASKSYVVVDGSWCQGARTSWIEDLSLACKSNGPGFPDVDASFVIVGGGFSASNVTTV